MSTVALLGVLAVWAVVGTWLASRWPGIVPPQVADDATDAEWRASYEAFLALQAHANIGRWRRMIVVTGMVAIILTWTVVEDQDRDRQREQDRRERAVEVEQRACEIRADSRVEVRAAIAAGVDEGARFAGLTAADRQVIVDRVEGRVRSELPPPDC